MQKQEEIIEVDYTKTDAIIEEIIDRVVEYMKNVPADLVRQSIIKAYLFAKEAHHGQIRKS
jgi:(p)ppGpp synthase/HD superfamily hydrolase